MIANRVGDADKHVVHRNHAVEIDVQGHAVATGDAEVLTVAAEVNAIAAVQRAQRRRQLYSADREHLVHRHTGVVDEDAERAGKRDARNIELHRRRHRARETSRSNQQRAASIAHAHEVRRAVAETQRNIRSGDADNRPGHAAGSRRRASRAFKGEVTAQTLADDGKADVRAFDAEIRTRRQIDNQRLAADQDAFIHVRRGVVDGKAERAGETNQRN